MTEWLILSEVKDMTIYAKTISTFWRIPYIVLTGFRCFTTEPMLIKEPDKDLIDFNKVRSKIYED